MLVNLRKNRDHHKQNSEHITINPSNHLRANTPTDLKTYRASRQEQDECSICPSIEKLKLTQEQELQDVHEQNGENLYEVPVEELIVQSRLKNKALEKASYMIKLLEEENQELLSQVGYLETLLKDRERQIQSLQEQIKQIKPSQSHAFIKQLMNQRQAHSSKHQSQNIINITNQFYTFAQHRDRTFTRKSQSKIVNLDHPSFKDMNVDINISKKLTPYASKNQVQDGNNSNNNSINHLLANLAGLIVQEGIGNSRVVMEEINELIVAEEQEQEQIMHDLQELEQQIDQECELPHSPQTSKISRRLFTLQKSQSNDSSSSITDLLQQYQRCIQGYKEYAAYLRAHLCQSINFLSQQPLPTRSSDSSWLSNFLKMAARDIGKTIKKNFCQLQQQNWQLKHLMQQLIHNIEITQTSSSILPKKAY